ncbi:MAG: FHA domain-containing protein [Tannerellaceae bacterium]|jgi:hypothetical protein|nr:FHA domain-containing protein [Tannerellaceae bacterium]
MLTIKIGKAKDNDFVVDAPSVSRHHALLKRDENGSLFLEDLSSTNGTFVNGIQILKKRIACTDTVLLGKSPLNISEALNSNNDYIQEFAALKEVYEKYTAQKVRIQSATTFRTRLFQAAPFALPGIVGFVISFSGSGGMIFRAICLAIAVCAPAAGIYMGAQQAAKAPQQLQELADQFKIDYVCPKCGIFLGEIPWESLANKKNCSVQSCKAKWANRT